AQAGGWLQRDRADQLLAGGNAAEDAAGVVAEEALRSQLVAVFGAELLDDVEAGADLDALDRVDAHQRCSKFGIELAVDLLAPARWHAVDDDGDPRTDRIAGLAQCVHELFELADHRRIGPEERIALDRIPVEAARAELADLREVAADADAE